MQGSLQVSARRTAPEVVRTSRWRRILRGNSKLIFGALLLLPLVLSSIFADQVAPMSPLQQDIRSRLMPPGTELSTGNVALLGTDHLGRDLLSRILHGGRISLGISLVSATLACLLGTLLGLAAGLLGGRAATVIMRITDIQIAFPFLVMAIAVVAVVGPSVPALVVTFVVWTWAPFSRVVYGETLNAMTQLYVQAAVALGASRARLALRHVLPNIVSPLIVLWTFTLAQIVIFESSLSFLGLGVQPPTPTWGVMLSEGRQYINNAWWYITFPGLTIMLVVLAVNVLGDGLRDRFDPRSRE